MRSKIEDEIKEFIANEILEGDRIEELPDDVPLLSGLIDSFGLMSLIGFLEERYGVTISNDQIVRSNFESVSVLAGFVEAQFREGGFDEHVAGAVGE